MRPGIERTTKSYEDLADIINDSGDLFMLTAALPVTHPCGSVDYGGSGREMATIHHRHSYLGAAFFLLLAPFLSLRGYAAERSIEQPREPLRIVYAGLSGNQAPGWAAYEGGFFRKHGLDVELVNVVGGATAVQTLLSGDVQFAQVSGLPVLESSLQGSGVVILAGLLNTMNYRFIVGREIRRPDHSREALSDAQGYPEHAARVSR